MRMFPRFPCICERMRAVDVYQVKKKSGDLAKQHKSTEGCGQHFGGDGFHIQHLLIYFNNNQGEKDQVKYPMPAFDMGKRRNRWQINRAPRR